MNKLFGNPKTRYRNILLFIIPFLLFSGVFGYVAYSSARSLFPNGGSSADYKDSIESMDYHLRPNATDVQIEYFHELQDLINSDAEKPAIAACVAKNYIADFYTWTNKSGSYDIGGMYYVYSPQKVNIISQAKNTYYKYLTYYINKFGQDKMLEVTDVEAVAGDEKLSYSIDGKTYEAYFVTCNWTYKNEETFKDLNISLSNQFETKENQQFVTRLYLMVIINDDGRYEIVQVYGDY